MEKIQNKDWLQAEVLKKPLRQIAEELSISYNRVRSACVLLKINIPKRNKRRVFPHKSINQKNAICRDFPNGRFGKLCPRWKGGRRIANQNGYIMIYSPDHPRCTKAKYVMEHILVAEKIIGRYLLMGEIVHHINGNKTDNRPENLKVIMKNTHVREHFKAVQEVDRLKKILDSNHIPY